MQKLKAKSKNNLRINKIGTTTDTLTSRGGLSLFVRYLRNIEIFPHLHLLFGCIRKSSKGQSVIEIFKQLFCFFVDGTSRHLVYFDKLKEDSGYAGVIESSSQTLLSSDSVKRFYRSFYWFQIWLFRMVLQMLFIWRLNLTKPSIIELGVDGMLMDNDEAEKRHGVEPTHKKYKGFHPLQMTWDRFIIDAVFRGGKKHCNHGDTVEKMVRHIVSKIRNKYREDVPIIIKTDSGFFDQKLFEVFEELGIGYICSGKLYNDIKEHIKKSDQSGWCCYENKKQSWDYLEFMDRRDSWSTFRRAIFCRAVYDGKQQLLDFARSETIIYTNIGMCQEIDNQLKSAGCEYFFKADNVIECAHSRGKDELIHRAFKDFGHEELPFKRFAPNAAYYYTMVLAFFLYEIFKEDVCSVVVPVVSYATTLRRKIIDIAAKIAKTSGEIILRVTTSTWKHIKIDILWEKSGSPPCFFWA